jgi:lipoprotein-anchoring transpeptidase ErfK/SrfK
MMRLDWISRRTGAAAIVLALLSYGAPPGLASLPTGTRTTVARQAALDRAGFSPGVLDGRAGRKTVLALKAFQAARGLPATGQFDRATLAALHVADHPATVTHTITAGDMRAVGPVPRDWNAKAKLNRLRYESLAALLAERGHCTRALLARLNPGRNLARLRPGDRVVLPNVWPHKLPRTASLTVDLDNKTVCARNKAGRTIAIFHCSIAKFAEKRPRGRAHVTSVAFDPAYTFNLKMWPEVRSVTHTLRIPPGPRNPVGVCWIDLSLPGYGIHGTPTPELIGKTGSHGCIRLANWDARRLGQMVHAGTPVHFVSR